MHLIHKVLVCLAIFGASGYSGSRPGIDAPIRVGIFTGEGAVEGWHTSIHTAAAVMQSMLANPVAANLGPSLVIPPKGFTVQQFGDNDSVTGNGGGTTVCHSGSDCGPREYAPTAQAITDFIHALDTLDVVVLPSCLEFGAMISDSVSQAKFMNFASTKGVVSIHATIDDNKLNIWPAFNSLEGAVFQNHPSSDRQAMLKRDTLPQNTTDPSFSFLNTGLLDTAFTDEWFSFTTSSAAIRAVPYLHVTLTIDENSYVGGLGGATAMGDHPMSWYRNFPTGGRFFYSSFAHESQNYTTVANRFVRRELYNAIMWTGNYGPFQGGDGIAQVEKEPIFGVSIENTSLIVSPISVGPHTIVIQSLDGKRLFEAMGRNQQSHVFNLRSGSLYIVTVISANARQEKLVLME